MKNLGNTEAEPKKSVAYKKSVYFIILSFFLQSYKITELQPLWIFD